MSIFTDVKLNRPKRSTFNLSHERKMSFNMGQLIPTLVMDVIPGDKFTISTSQVIRFSPLTSPVMHRVSVYHHYFYVPNRIMMQDPEDWENFITGGIDGQDATVAPFVEVGQGETAPGSIGDYLGLPSLGAGQSINVLAFPYGAYHMIYDQYYRDQNLQTSDWFPLSVGSNDIGDYDLIRNRAWQHDYFTSALPWTQKGAEATIPLGATAPLSYLADGNPDFIKDTTGTSISGLPVKEMIVDADGNFDANNAGTYIPANLDNSAHLSVDLTSATAATINDLRNAFRLQEWLERNARGGTRYVEAILSHFGVHTGDSSVQRPIFLGGTSSPVSFSEVLQTSSTATEPTPQGNMAGHGINASGSRPITYTCKDYGYIMCITSVMPKTAYQQGVPRHWSRFDKFDYYWSAFAHLGEQPILNKEIYADGSAADDEVFGYIPRYAEYKYIPDSVHGEFRTSLDFWHMGRKFATRPALNSTFISADPTTRIFAVTEAEHLRCHIYHNIKSRRPMPYFGTPMGV